MRGTPMNDYTHVFEGKSWALLEIFWNQRGSIQIGKQSPDNERHYHPAEKQTPNHDLFGNDLLT